MGLTTRKPNERIPNMEPITEPVRDIFFRAQYEPVAQIIEKAVIMIVEMNM